MNKIYLVVAYHKLSLLPKDIQDSAGADEYPEFLYASHDRSVLEAYMDSLLYHNPSLDVDICEVDASASASIPKIPSFMEFSGEINMKLVDVRISLIHPIPDGIQPILRDAYGGCSIEFKDELASSGVIPFHAIFRTRSKEPYKKFVERVKNEINNRFLEHIQDILVKKNKNNENIYEGV